MAVPVEPQAELAGMEDDRHAIVEGGMAEGRVPTARRRQAEVVALAKQGLTRPTIAKRF
jgi:hypothetical protein